MCRFIYGPLPCHYERDLLLLAHTDAANTSAAAGGRAGRQHAGGRACAKKQEAQGADTHARISGGTGGATAPALVLWPCLDSGAKASLY